VQTSLSIFVDALLFPRYLDMIVNPEVGDVFRSRAKVLSTIRRYLEDRGFLDIETPVLQVTAADLAPLRMVVKPVLPDVQLSRVDDVKVRLFRRGSVSMKRSALHRCWEK
jgi:aspartyl/asparaginyl-tRNA synthetase